MSALLMAIVTAEEPLRFSGRYELYMSRLLPKHLSTLVRRLSSKCISCRARIAIFSLFIVLLTVDHLSMWSIFCDGAVAPFMFSVAMQMLALFFGSGLSLNPPGVGFAAGWGLAHAASVLWC